MTSHVTYASSGDVSPNSSDRLVVRHYRQRSLPMAALHLLLRPLRPRIVLVRKHRTGESQKLQPNSYARKRCEVNERCVDGIWVYDLRAKQDFTDKSTARQESRMDGAAPVNGEIRSDGRTVKRIYYFAGGAWQMPPSPTHWAAAAAMATRIPGAVVTLVSSPLAPNAPAAVSLPLLRRLYSALMKQSREAGERVILMGDSSGGNIALSLVTWATTSVTYTSKVGIYPAAVMVISPSTDLRHEHAGIKESARHDPLLTPGYISSTAKTWCKGLADESSSAKGSGANTMEADNPSISPVLADLTPLASRGVRVHGITGSYDCLAPEAVAFREKLAEAGVVGEWLEWDKQMHCFPLAFRYHLKESVAAMDWMVDVLSRV
jgi:acetyl esterase/lipase